MCFRKVSSSLVSAGPPWKGFWGVLGRWEAVKCSRALLLLRVQCWEPPEQRAARNSLDFHGLLTTSPCSGPFLQGCHLCCALCIPTEPAGRATAPKGGETTQHINVPLSTLLARLQQQIWGWNRGDSLAQLRAQVSLSPAESPGQSWHLQEVPLSPNPLEYPQLPANPTVRHQKYLSSIRQGVVTLLSSTQPIFLLFWLV